VGDDALLERTKLQVERCNWIAFDTPPGPLEVTAKIRYNHAGSPATVTPLGNNTAQVQFHTTQRAVTPGQACVFYQGDLVLGGGWINRS
jgi:tRNA-uridine 2-sulfurtransferase